MQPINNEPNKEQLEKNITELNILINQCLDEISKVVVGQKSVVKRLLMGLVLNGHLLLEGVPGLAKTTMVRAVAKILGASFGRIQFTPDLLPADVIGTQVYEPHEQKFSIKKGPVFTNILLADEINRAPAKVQSALLEAMQERQITIGAETFQLSYPFIVLATQNPIEQEGTYPLPEAQMDRFLFKLNLTYPDFEDELKIMDHAVSSSQDYDAISGLLSIEKLKQISSSVEQVYLDEKIKRYILDIVQATRDPKSLNQELSSYLQFGASPRASIALYQSAKCMAFFNARPFVTPQDVKDIAADVLRHRILLSYEAEAESISTDFVIQKILGQIKVP